MALATMQMGEIASISAPLHQPIPIAADKHFDAEFAEHAGFHRQSQIRAGRIRSVGDLNMIRLVTAHHLVAR